MAKKPVKDPGTRSGRRKTAMVQPAPEKPDPGQGGFSFSDPGLAKILTQLGNTRAYTILATLNDGWLVHFEGEIKPCTVNHKDGSWHITPKK